MCGEMFLLDVLRNWRVSVNEVLFLSVAACSLKSCGVILVQKRPTSPPVPKRNTALWTGARRVAHARSPDRERSVFPDRTTGSCDQTKLQHTKTELLNVFKPCPCFVVTRSLTSGFVGSGEWNYSCFTRTRHAPFRTDQSFLQYLFY